MNVIKIVVDELPEICNLCHFEDSLDYAGCHFCYAARKSISREKNYTLSRPSWCPLVADDEVCEWKDKVGRTTACGTTYAEMEIVYCPNCGKRIKYIK